MIQHWRPRRVIWKEDPLTLTVLRSRNYRRFQILRLKDSRHHWGKSLNSGQYSPDKIKTVVSTPHLPHFQESSHHGKVCRSFRFRDIIASQGKGRISKLCCVLLQTRTSSSSGRRCLRFPRQSIQYKVTFYHDGLRGRRPWTRQQGLKETELGNYPWEAVDVWILPGSIAGCRTGYGIEGAMVCPS